MWIPARRKCCAQFAANSSMAPMRPARSMATAWWPGVSRTGWLRSSRTSRSGCTTFTTRRWKRQEMMRVLGIITARGGSKGIPRKNVALLLGKPLLAYTAEAALASKKLTRTVLSTDDPEIATIGKQLGLDVPFPRPAELAKDDTPTIPVLQDVVRRLEAMGEVYDAILTLQPTNPLRLVSDIDGAIELLERTGADSVISFSDVGERHPA